MLLYEDYFSCNTSPVSSSFIQCSNLDTRVYDIIFIPSSYTQENLKQQCSSTINWFDHGLVSELYTEMDFVCLKIKL
jgi:hypothetical protein